MTLLSKQEKRILAALSSGSLYKEIAADYNISINTVKKHLKNIYRKLSVNKRTQAIEMYLQDAGMGEVIPMFSSAALPDKQVELAS